MRRVLPVYALVFAALLLAPTACKKKSHPTTPAAPTDTPTPAWTATSTPTLNQTGTATFTDTATATPTSSPTETATPTNTVWPTPVLVATFGPGTYGSVRGMAVDASGVYVADGTNGLVRKFNPQGTPVAGWTAPSVTDAWGLAVDSSANLYVSSDSGNTLYKFNASATPVATWDLGVSGANLKCDGSDNLWATSTLLGSRVQKFSAAGALLGNWNTADGWAFGVEVIGTTLYVGGVNSKNVELFSLTGTSLGSWNSGVDNLALAASPSGNLYCTGDASAPVKYFTPSGSLIGQWGSFQSTGMCVDASGNIYVGSYNTGIVRKYQP